MTFERKLFDSQHNGGANHRYVVYFMTVRTILFIFGHAAFGFLSGCSGKTVAEADERPVLRVNGVDVTPADLKREVDFRLALVQFRKGKPVDTEKIRARIARNVTNEVIAGLLYQTYPLERNAAVQAAVEKDLAARYRRTFVPRRKTFEDFEDYLKKGALWDVYTNNFAREAAREMYYAQVHGDDLKVTDADIDRVMARIAAFNATAAATNALAYAKATNVWRQINAGADFAKLADATSEDADRQPGGALGLCEEIDFEGVPGYWAAVSALKTGEISDVLTTDVGIEIVKALTDLAPSVDTGEPARELARIYIRRAMTIPPSTREEETTELAQYRRTQIARRSFREVVSNATIVVNGVPRENDYREDVNHKGEKKKHEKDNH